MLQKKQTFIFDEQMHVDIDVKNRLKDKVKQLLPPTGTILIVDGKEYKIDDYLICLEHPKFGTVYVHRKDKNGEWFEFSYGIIEPNTSNVWDFVKQE